MMLNLTAILSLINASISSWVPGKSQLMGLAQLSKRPQDDGKDRVWPSEYDENGEAIYAGIDDDYDLIIYHRLLGMGVSPAATGKYGRKVSDTKNTLRMCMVLFAKRTCLKLGKDELALNVQASFPDQITGGDKPKNIKTMNISISDIVLNEEQVFNEEYKNVDYFVSPEHIFLKVNYTIESTFDKNCFNKC